jgi:hypothetical protein
MSEDNYQDLGIDGVGPMNLSDLSIEAQAQEAFHRMAPKVPPELAERFIQMGTEACRQAASKRPDGQVSTDELVTEFEGILRNLMAGRG